MFCKDRDGVVELPFKLIIASIILVITISIAYTGLENFSESTINDRVETAVASISSTAGEVSTMGVNSSLKVKVDDYKCKGIGYKITGHKETWNVVKDHAGHDLVMRGMDGKSCALSDGTHEILIIKTQDHLIVSVV